MSKKNLKKQKSQEGITLFVTLILMGVLLGVSASLLNITLKQYQLSGVSYASEIAFQAANAGMECALYHDWVHDEFELSDTRDAVSCFDLSSVSDTGDDPNNDGIADSGEEQRFEFEWAEACIIVSVYKFSPGAQVTVDGEDLKDPSGSNNECPTSSVGCTVIQSRGYNFNGCDVSAFGPRVVEREYTQVY